jgi:hypothetical protein
VVIRLLDGFAIAFSLIQYWFFFFLKIDTVQWVEVRNSSAATCVDIIDFIESNFPTFHFLRIFEVMHPSLIADDTQRRSRKAVNVVYKRVGHTSESATQKHTKK